MKADADHLVEFINVQKTYDGEELVVKNPVSYTHLTLPTTPYV